MTKEIPDFLRGCPFIEKPNAIPTPDEQRTKLNEPIEMKPHEWHPIQKLQIALEARRSVRRGIK